MDWRPRYNFGSWWTRIALQAEVFVPRQVIAKNLVLKKPGTVAGFFIVWVAENLPPAEGLHKLVHLHGHWIFIGCYSFGFAGDHLIDHHDALMQA
jgi:hypothetical protein